METYLGLDFGGTKLLIGEVDRAGKILREKRYETGCRQELQAMEVLVDSLKDYIRTVGFEGNPKGAGIGIVGTVDHKNGLWITMHPQISTPPIPIADILQKLLRIPVWADNDVKSATTAEMVFGSGRSLENFVYLNVGTGLAAGFVVDGRILRGRSNNAGEIGHTVMELYASDACICGRRGCVENVVSGYGFTKQIRNYGLTELVPPKGYLADVTLLFERAQRGEELPGKILDHAARSLSCLIMNLVKTLDPEAFILGGGCVRDGILLKRINETLTPSIMSTVTEGILLSKLDPVHTGLLGAAALALAARLS